MLSVRSGPKLYALGSLEPLILRCLGSKPVPARGGFGGNDRT
jgi:hypothetical protein